ncbi:MAG: hypothetical protein DYH05_06725 [Acidobacteria bacterium ACB1]|nr:hypothetical protein [Pyrinomonadaceae bacterium]MCE7962179.1 hypothetical protein [Acidobacteria bacterium ACB1]RIJ91222.1 MAG: hypothetical protein DCC44_09575 [Acidobacteriota bacterium]
MNIIKVILAIIGIFFAGFAALWVLGLLSTLIWYLFWIAIIGGLIYGGVRLFKKMEAKALGYEPQSRLDTNDIQMSWDEYHRKYINK